jgi:predicted nucleic acid-binding protein
MRIVLDASAAAHVAVDGAKAEGFREVLRKSKETLAPELVIPELVNAMWKAHQFSKMEAGECERAIEQAISLIDSLVSGKDLCRAAFQLARTAQKPAYDMFYLALAAREGATLLTLDSSLKKEAERRGIQAI